MKKKFLLMAICITLLILGGCGGKQYDTTKLKAMKRVALVSLTLQKVGQGEDNDIVHRKAVEYAAKVYNQKLSTIPGWQIVNPPKTEELDRAFSNLPSSKIASAVLSDLAEQNQLPGEFGNAAIAKIMIATFRGDTVNLEKLKGEAIAGTAKQMQGELDKQRKWLAWPKGMAGIPYQLSSDEGMSSALTTIRRKELEAYRKRHKLDGIILIHQASAVGSPGDIRVIVQGNRILSSLKVNPVMFVRGEGGEVAYATGSTRLDDLAPMKFAMPIYTGEKEKRGTFGNFKLNLNDPKGVSLAGYKKLIDKTAQNIVSEFIEDLQK